MSTRLPPYKYTGTGPGPGGPGPGGPGIGMAVACAGCRLALAPPLHPRSNPKARVRRAFMAAPSVFAPLQLDLSQAQEFSSSLAALMLECFRRNQSSIPPKPSKPVMKALRCALENTESQHGEDLLLLPTLLLAAGGRPGSFVELGALNGVRYSNTVVLERCFGWRGVLIEGNPDNFDQLQRSSRAAVKVHSAVCRGEGTVAFTAGGSQEAGDLSVLRAADLRSVAFNKPNHSAAVNVSCRPLSRIVDEAGFRDSIDFLSLDVQGAELRVLQASRPAQFGLIMSEYYGFGGVDERRRKSIAKLVEGAGLRPMRSHGKTQEQFYVFGSDIYFRRGLQPVRVWPEERKRLRESNVQFYHCKARLRGAKGRVQRDDPAFALWGDDVGWKPGGVSPIHKSG